MQGVDMSRIWQYAQEKSTSYQKIKKNIERCPNMISDKFLKGAF